MMRTKDGARLRELCRVDASLVAADGCTLDGPEPGTLLVAIRPVAPGAVKADVIFVPEVSADIRWETGSHKGPYHWELRDEGDEPLYRSGRLAVQDDTADTVTVTFSALLEEGMA
jgi:hypothetical protein